MKSNLTVVTPARKDHCKQVEWCLEGSILVIEEGDMNLCVPLNNVLCYYFPREALK